MDYKDTNLHPCVAGFQAWAEVPPRAWRFPLQCGLLRQPPPQHGVQPGGGGLEFMKQNNSNKNKQSLGSTVLVQWGKPQPPQRYVSSPFLPYGSVRALPRPFNKNIHDSRIHTVLAAICLCLSFSIASFCSASSASTRALTSAYNRLCEILFTNSKKLCGMKTELLYIPLVCPPQPGPQPLAAE